MAKKSSWNDNQKNLILATTNTNLNFTHFKRFFYKNLVLAMTKKNKLKHRTF